MAHHMTDHFGVMPKLFLAPFTFGFQQLLLALKILLIIMITFIIVNVNIIFIQTVIAM